jgi:phosphotransferase system enzyme I (PtsI)
MNATAIPAVKAVLRGTRLAEAKALANEAIALPTAAEVEALVEKRMLEWFPKDLLHGGGGVSSAS